jgi:hypothetical protein
MNSGVCKWCGLDVSGEPVMAGERFMTLIWDWTRTRVHDLKPPRKSPLRRGRPRKEASPQNGQAEPRSSGLILGLAGQISAIL